MIAENKASKQHSKIFNNNDGERPSNSNSSTSISSDNAKSSQLHFYSTLFTPKRPSQLFSSPNHLNRENNNCESAVNWHSPSATSSEEDNSPTQMNNCRKFIDKAPLVKRLSISLLRSAEQYRPLINNFGNFSTASSSSVSSASTSATTSLSSAASTSSTTTAVASKTTSTTSTNSNYLTASTTHIPNGTSSTTGTSSGIGYENETMCYGDTDEIISSKFGDSCRKSLTSVLDNRRKDYCEFDLKRNFLRETSSANSSPKMFANSAKQKRIRGLSIIEQHELKEEPWFQIGVPREISLEVLRRKQPGDFLVRESSTKPGCFALSLRAPPPAPKVVHYLILRTPRGFKIKGCAKEFTTLKALITHHSVMPEQLPVTLTLARPKHLLAQRRNLDDYDTYESIDDFHNLMI